jgi:hypothetical protein
MPSADNCSTQSDVKACDMGRALHCFKLLQEAFSVHIYIYGYRIMKHPSTRVLSEISGFHGGDYEERHHLGYDAVWLL